MNRKEPISDTELVERVLANDENTLPSFHPRIRVAKVREYRYEEVDDTMKQMAQLAREVDIPAVIDLMKALVPEYTCTTDYSKR